MKRRGRWSLLVVVGSGEEVVQDLEDDGNATARMVELVLTTRSQGP